MIKINNCLVSRGMEVSSEFFCLMAYNKNSEAEMQQLKEEWKPIKNYEDRYEISNFGKIKSLYYKRKKIQNLLKNTVNNTGYYQITLYGNIKKTSFKIHHLVYDHFGEKKRNGRILQIDHKDGNKLNNRIDNLHLLTARENSVKYFKKQKHSSCYVGVTWNIVVMKWIARISINGKTKHLGCFKNEYEAYCEYQKAHIVD